MSATKKTAWIKIEKTSQGKPKISLGRSIGQKRRRLGETPRLRVCVSKTSISTKTGFAIGEAFDTEDEKKDENGEGDEMGFGDDEHGEDKDEENFGLSFAAQADTQKLLQISAEMKKPAPPVVDETDYGFSASAISNSRRIQGPATVFQDSDKTRLELLKRALHIAGLWALESSITALNKECVKSIQKLFGDKCVAIAARSFLKDQMQIPEEDLAECRERMTATFVPAVWLTDKLNELFVRPDLVSSCVLAVVENILVKDSCWPIAISLYNAFVQAHLVILALKS